MDQKKKGDAGDRQILRRKTDKKKMTKMSVASKKNEQLGQPGVGERL